MSVLFVGFCILIIFSCISALVEAPPTPVCHVQSAHLFLFSNQTLSTFLISCFCDLVLSRFFFWIPGIWVQSASSPWQTGRPSLHNESLFKHFSLLILLRFRRPQLFFCKGNMRPSSLLRDSASAHEAAEALLNFIKFRNVNPRICKKHSNEKFNMKCEFCLKLCSLEVLLWVSVKFTFTHFICGFCSFTLILSIQTWFVCFYFYLLFNSVVSAVPPLFMPL